MNDFKNHLNEQLKDPAFASEWERQRPEREYIKAIDKARRNNKKQDGGGKYGNRDVIYEK